MAAIDLAAKGADGSTSVYLEELLVNADVVAGKGVVPKATLTAALIRSMMGLAARTPGKAATLLTRFALVPGFLAAAIPFLAAGAAAGAGDNADDYAGGPQGVAYAIGDFVATNATYVLKAAPGGGGGASRPLPFAGCRNAAGLSVSVLPLAEQIAYFGARTVQELSDFLTRADCVPPAAAGAGGDPRPALFAAACAYLTAVAPPPAPPPASAASASGKGIPLFSLGASPTALDTLVKVSSTWSAGSMPSASPGGGAVQLVLPLRSALPYATVAYVVTGDSNVSLAQPLNFEAQRIKAASAINHAFVEHIRTGIGGDAMRGFFNGQDGSLLKLMNAIAAASSTPASVALGSTRATASTLRTVEGSAWLLPRAALATTAVVVSVSTPSRAFKALAMVLRCLAAIADAGDDDADAGDPLPLCARQVDAICAAIAPAMTGFDATGHNAEDVMRVVTEDLHKATNSAIATMTELIVEGGSVVGISRDVLCSAQLFNVTNGLTPALDALLAAPPPASKNAPWASAPAPTPRFPTPAPHEPPAPLAGFFTFEVSERLRTALSHKAALPKGSSLVMDMAAARVAMGGVALQPCLRSMAGLVCGAPGSPPVTGRSCPARAKLWHPTPAQAPAVLAALGAGG